MSGQSRKVKSSGGREQHSAGNADRYHKHSNKKSKTNKGHGKSSNSHSKALTDKQRMIEEALQVQRAKAASLAMVPAAVVADEPLQQIDEQLVHALYSAREGALYTPNYSYRMPDSSSQPIRFSFCEDVRRHALSGSIVSAHWQRAMRSHKLSDSNREWQWQQLGIHWSLFRGQFVRQDLSALRTDHVVDIHPYASSGVCLQGERFFAFQSMSSSSSLFSSPSAERTAVAVAAVGEEEEEEEEEEETRPFTTYRLPAEVHLTCLQIARQDSLSADSRFRFAYLTTLLNGQATQSLKVLCGSHNSRGLEPSWDPLLSRELKHSRIEHMNWTKKSDGLWTLSESTLHRMSLESPFRGGALSPSDLIWRSPHRHMCLSQMESCTLSGVTHSEDEDILFLGTRSGSVLLIDRRCARTASNPSAAQTIGATRFRVTQLHCLSQSSTHELLATDVTHSVRIFDLRRVDQQVREVHRAEGQRINERARCWVSSNEKLLAIPLLLSANGSEHYRKSQSLSASELQRRGNVAEGMGIGLFDPRYESAFLGLCPNLGQRSTTRSMCGTGDDSRTLRMAQFANDSQRHGRFQALLSWPSTSNAPADTHQSILSCNLTT